MGGCVIWNEFSFDVQGEKAVQGEETMRRHFAVTVAGGLAWMFVMAALLAPMLVARSPQGGDKGWTAYGGDGGGMRYSGAKQIDRGNVGQLKLAWSYRTGALDVKTKLIEKAAFEATPILVEGKLFLSTPYDHVIALDPERGTKLWEFDPRVDLDKSYSEVTSRGVSVWIDPAGKAGQICRVRIYLGTIDARLIALDGETGKVCGD